jgi:hypothetical protein
MPKGPYEKETKNDLSKLPWSFDVPGVHTKRFGFLSRNWIGMRGMKNWKS